MKHSETKPPRAVPLPRLVLALRARWQCFRTGGHSLKWVRKLFGVSLLTGWEQAGTTVEILGDDIDHVSPQQAAEDERDEWMACC